MSKMTKVIKTTWIHSLRRENLETYAAEFGLNTDGTADDIRKRLLIFVTEGNHSEEISNRLRELEGFHSRSASPGKFEMDNESDEEETPGEAGVKQNLPTTEGVSNISSSVQMLTRKLELLQSERPSPNQPSTTAKEDTAVQPPGPVIYAPSITGGPLKVNIPPSVEVVTRKLLELPESGHGCPDKTFPNQPSTSGSEVMAVQLPVPVINAQSTTRSHSNATVENWMNVVCKWGVIYDGGNNPLDFLERVEELADMYSIPLAWLPRSMPQMLTERGLMWYRGNNRFWDSWEAFRKDFLSFFLPNQYFEYLEDTIRQRTQNCGELFKDFVLASQTLMRHAHYSREVQLERIYRNSAPDIRLAIKRQDFRNLAELTQLAEGVEFILREKQSRVTSSRQVSNRMITPENPVPVDVRTACRRCSEPGHLAYTCTNPVVYFCWVCGRKGVYTKNCCRKSGNDNGMDLAGGEVSSNQPDPPTY